MRLESVVRRGAGPASNGGDARKWEDRPPVAAIGGTQEGLLRVRVHRAIVREGRGELDRRGSGAVEVRDDQAAPLQIPPGRGEGPATVLGTEQASAIDAR